MPAVVASSLCLPRLWPRGCRPRALAAGLALALAASAGRAVDTEPPSGEPDLRNGRDINGVCAGCHGDDGQGGKEGEYPRVGGLPAGYIYRQVKLFQQNVRSNLAMLEHVHERQMSDEEIRDISAFLAAIELPNRLDPMDEGDRRFDAYERMLATQRVVQIPAYPGDTEAGRKRYNKECRSCHGAEGRGDNEAEVPQLAGQYTAYLLRQIDKFRAGQRIHDPDDPEDDTLADFTRDELGDIFAYLSVVDD